jgi:hypothetical protein
MSTFITFYTPPVLSPLLSLSSQVNSLKQQTKLLLSPTDSFHRSQGQAEYKEGYHLPTKQDQGEISQTGTKEGLKKKERVESYKERKNLVG